MKLRIIKMQRNPWGEWEHVSGDIPGYFYPQFQREDGTWGFWWFENWPVGYSTLEDAQGYALSQAHEMLKQEPKMTIKPCWEGVIE